MFYPSRVGQRWRPRTDKTASTVPKPRQLVAPSLSNTSAVRDKVENPDAGAWVICKAKEGAGVIPAFFLLALPLCGYCVGTEKNLP